MTEATFVFADIAGYTALTDAHGDEQAAALVDRFVEGVSARLAEHDAELVKTVGDAVMLRVPEPAAAVSLGLAAVHEVMAEHGCPAVRAGMHHGSAVARGDDWLGGTVNLAARVAGAAASGEVLLSAAVRERAGDVAGVEFEDRGERRLRNVAEPVRVFAARRQAEIPREWPIDPVCRMAVEPGRETATVRHEGVEYRFCSLGCLSRFVHDPAAYTADVSG